MQAFVLFLFSVGWVIVSIVDVDTRFYIDDLVERTNTNDPYYMRSLTVRGERCCLESGPRTQRCRESCGGPPPGGLLFGMGEVAGAASGMFGGETDLLCA